MLVPVTSPQWTNVWQTTTKEKFLWKWLKTFRRLYITPEKCLLKKFSQVVFCESFVRLRPLTFFQTIESNFRWKYFAHFTKSWPGFHSITFLSGAARMFLLNPKIVSLQHLILFTFSRPSSVNISLPCNKAGLNKAISALTHRQTTFWKLPSFLHKKEKF